MPRGFERNIIWDSDPEKQPRYSPFEDAFRNAPGYRYHPYFALTFNEYDLGFLASLRIKA